MERGTAKLEVSRKDSRNYCSMVYKLMEAIYISCFSLYQVSLVNHLMEHVLVASHHANIATLLSLLNAPAVQWADSFTCINAFLPNSALQVHMEIPRLGDVKIAKLDVPLVVLPLV